jgi:hypothetical protein
MKDKIFMRLIFLSVRLILSSLLVLFCSLGLIAQNDTIVPVDEDPEKLLRKIDIREFTNGGFNFWDDDFSGHWAGVDFGFNLFINPDYSGYYSEFFDRTSAKQKYSRTGYRNGASI